MGGPGRLPTSSRPYDEADATAALEFSRRAMSIVPQGRRPFGEPVEASEEAAPLDRLVALLGRRPG